MITPSLKSNLGYKEGFTKQQDEKEGGDASIFP
jgi:hypothetical protein